MNYGVLTGTSMAAPHVAGAAARYLAANPGATAEDVRRALVRAGECPDGKSPTWLICSTKWLDDPDAETGSEPLIHVCPPVPGLPDSCAF
jgi:subtilisin family serine protease